MSKYPQYSEADSEQENNTEHIEDEKTEDISQNTTRHLEILAG